MPHPHLTALQEMLEMASGHLQVLLSMLHKIWRMPVPLLATEILPPPMCSPTPTMIMTGGACCHLLPAGAEQMDMHVWQTTSLSLLITMHLSTLSAHSARQLCLAC